MADQSRTVRDVIFRQRPYSGVLVPHYVNPSQERQVALPNFVRVSVSYSSIYGTQGSWEDAAERLCQYDLGTILNTLGQISSAIHAKNGPELLETQIALTNWLFEDRAGDVLDAAKQQFIDTRQSGINRATPIALFHELQVVNTAKIALLEVPLDKLSSATSPEALGEALLIVDDLLGSDAGVNRPPSNPSTDEERFEWERFFVVNGFFHHAGNPQPNLVRSWDLYLQDRPHLSDLECYHNLPALVEELTGLSREQLWARLCAVYSHWGKGIDLQSDDLPGPLDSEGHFTDNYNFSPEEEKKFWSIVTADAEGLRDRFKERGCSPSDLKPFYALPLEQYPLVRFEGNLFCPSSLLMQRRMTSGLHHLIYNRLPKKKRKDYQTYMGAVFEDYILQSLERNFGGKANRLIREADIKDKIPEGYSPCDAIIVYPDGLLLVEVKASKLRFEDRVGGDEGDIDEIFERVFVNPARQLDSVIRLIQQGELAEFDLLPHKIHRYVPISVCRDPIPMNQMSYTRLQHQLQREGVLQQQEAVPLQLLAPEDVEALEVAGEKGRSVIELLVRRVADEAHHTAGLLNYLGADEDSLLNNIPKRMERKWDELTGDALSVFRERER